MKSTLPAKSVREATAVAKESRVCTLLPGCRVRDVADACRSAALGFAWSAHHGWGKRELARWLIGPYARAVASTRSLRTSGIRPAVLHRPIEESTVAELLIAAHGQILEVLRSVWTWPREAAFARASIDDGLVAGIVDETSELGYGPIDRVSMRLIDRVRSLFVADYLTRPADYAAFAVCDDCDGATFDGGLYHVACARPRRHTVLRRRVVRELRLPRDLRDSNPDADADANVGVDTDAVPASATRQRLARR